MFAVLLRLPNWMIALFFPPLCARAGFLVLQLLHSVACLLGCVCVCASLFSVAPLVFGGAIRQLFTMGSRNSVVRHVVGIESIQC